MAAIVVGDIVGIVQSYYTQWIVPTWLWWLILVIILILSPFIVFCKIQKELDEYRNRIHLSATINSISASHCGDKKTVELDITANVIMTIWTDIDIHTESLQLNVVGIREKKWWQLLKWFLPKTKRLFGIPISPQNNTLYRKQIRKDAQQPFTDSITFSWKGKRTHGYWYIRGWQLDEAIEERGFYFELVLTTGSPGGIWRAKATIIPLRGRGKGITHAI